MRLSREVGLRCAWGGARCDEHQIAGTTCSGLVKEFNGSAARRPLCFSRSSKHGIAFGGCSAAGLTLTIALLLEGTAAAPLPGSPSPSRYS